MNELIKDGKELIRVSLANAITFSNLALGGVSLLCMFKNQYFLAAILILFGTLLDRMDGMIARKFDSTSNFGSELDSLADLVTFGVSPSMLIWLLTLNNIRTYGAIITIVYILAGAFRLARFNCAEKTNSYVGVPITVIGGLLTILSLLVMRYNINQYLIAFLVILMSYGMVTTKIKIKKM